MQAKITTAHSKRAGPGAARDALEKGIVGLGLQGGPVWGRRSIRSILHVVSEVFVVFVVYMPAVVACTIPSRLQDFTAVIQGLSKPFGNLLAICAPRTSKCKTNAGAERIASIRKEGISYSPIASSICDEPLPLRVTTLIERGPIIRETWGTVPTANGKSKSVPTRDGDGDGAWDGISVNKFAVARHFDAMPAIGTKRTCRLTAGLEDRRSRTRAHVVIYRRHSSGRRTPRPSLGGVCTGVLSSQPRRCRCPCSEWNDS
jgi:hypothetical protein